MTNKITVPSELIHRAIDAIEQVGYQDKFIDYTFVRAVKQELRAALADPVPPAGGQPQVVGYMQDRSDGEPLITLESHKSYVAQLRSKIKDLCDHPSMSFHQIALLEGVLDAVPDGELVDREHVTRLQAEVEECREEREAREAELTKAREVEVLHLNACPSCSGRFAKLKTCSNAMMGHGYYVECESCGAKTSGYDKAASAAHEWNGEVPQ